MSEHTPGPWFLINSVCVGGPIDPGWEDAGCGIAHCGMRARTQGEAEANARLITAAPDLIEALEMVRDADIDNKMNGNVGIPSVARAKIDAAIAKARGQS